MNNTLILDALCYGKRNMFIQGGAGTGKSTLIHAMQDLVPVGILYTAPTGIAALTIGETIHSLFNLKASIQIPGEYHTIFNTTLLEKAHTLVIDEISMVRCDVLDKIDEVLRQIRNTRLRFGGMRIIMVGDIFQLGPITTQNEAPYLKEVYLAACGDYSFYHAKCFNIDDFDVYELTQNHRQRDDEAFATILAAIQTGKVDKLMLNRLNTCSMSNFPSDPFYYIAMNNEWANSHNKEQIAALPDRSDISEPQVILTIWANKLGSDEAVQRCLMNKKLEIKKGMQIMFLMNDKDKRWVNGTIGMIVEKNYNTHNQLQSVRVQVRDTVYEVQREQCKLLKPVYNHYNDTVEIAKIADIYQFPFQAAWAMTVHKAQGLTLDKIVLNIGYGAFASGQVYVALSRVKRLADCYLEKYITTRDIIVSKHTRNFYQTIQDHIKHNPNDDAINQLAVDYYDPLIIQDSDFTINLRNTITPFTPKNNLDDDFNFGDLNDISKYQTPYNRK